MSERPIGQESEKLRRERLLRILGNLRDEAKRALENDAEVTLEQKYGIERRVRPDGASEEVRPSGVEVVILTIVRDPPPWPSELEAERVQSG